MFPIPVGHIPYFGSFHLLMIVFACLAVVCGIVFGREYSLKKNPDKVRNMILIASIAFIGMELQSFLLYVKWHEWTPADLPLQLCSIVLFIYPALLLVKNRKVWNLLVSFLTVTGNAAAVLYFIHPSNAFTTPHPIIMANGLAWHICMLGFNTYLLTAVQPFEKHPMKMFAEQCALACWISAAVAWIDHVFDLFRPDLNVNFFFVSPSKPPVFSVRELLFGKVEPYWVYLIEFMIALVLQGILVMIPVLIARKHRQNMMNH